MIAWLGVAVQYQGRPIEASPRSVLGIFFATYWAGSPQQCGTSDTDVGLPAGAPAGAQPVMLASTEAPGSGGAAPEEPEELGGGGCTACVFPAAAVIAQGLFTLAFLAALWVTSARLVAAVLNTRLKRRVRLFQAAYSLLAVAGGPPGASCLHVPHVCKRTAAGLCMQRHADTFAAFTLAPAHLLACAPPVLPPLLLQAWRPWASAWCGAPSPGSTSAAGRGMWRQWR